MKWALHVALTYGMLLATAAVAVAQSVPQPVVRVGNWWDGTSIGVW